MALWAKLNGVSGRRCSTPHCGRARTHFPCLPAWNALPRCILPPCHTLCTQRVDFGGAWKPTIRSGARACLTTQQVLAIGAEDGVAHDLCPALSRKLTRSRLPHEGLSRRGLVVLPHSPLSAARLLLKQALNVQNPGLARYLLPLSRRGRAGPRFLPVR